MSSTVISFTKHLATLGSPDGVVTLNMPLDWGNGSSGIAGGRMRHVELIKASFSALIPNVIFAQPGVAGFTQGINTGLIRVTRDNWASFVDVQLQTGIYTLKYIELAIVSATLNWWINPDEPGIRFWANPATQKVYITLDSSRVLGPPGKQLGINLGRSEVPNPQCIGDLLGFTATRIFTADGNHIAPSFAQLDWFGQHAHLYVEGLGRITIANGSSGSELASIPLSMTRDTASNIYVYPSGDRGIKTPLIPIPDCPNQVRTLHFHFFGSTVEPSGLLRPLVIMGGDVDVIIRIAW